MYFEISRFQVELLIYYFSRSASNYSDICVKILGKLKCIHEINNLVFALLLQALPNRKFPAHLSREEIEQIETKKREHFEAWKKNPLKRQLPKGSKAVGKWFGFYVSICVFAKGYWNFSLRPHQRLR